jgi:hypothetical protein
MRAKSACALRNKTTSTNELNEVVISDSKFALAKEKSGKVIVKLRLRNCLRNQVNLLLLF